MLNVRFESAFSPCKQRDVASNYGFPGRYDADRASLIGKVFPSGTAPEATSNRISRDMPETHAFDMAPLPVDVCDCSLKASQLGPAFASRANGWHRKWPRIYYLQEILNGDPGATGAPKISSS